VWYRYTAASTSPVVISTLGSDFDTMIAVYAGTTLSGLSAVVCNDQFNGTGEARVTWTPLVGVTYEIQVGGFYDSAGDLVLQLINPPANDNFVNAQVLSLPGAVTGSNADASMEVGEPIPNCGGTGTSVWFRLVPTSSGGLTATTAGSTFDTTLALYSGTSLGTLTQLACNDDSMDTQQSQLVVNVSAGSTYYLRLAGYAGEAGAYTLTTSLGDALPPSQCPTFTAPARSAPRWVGGRTASHRTTILPRAGLASPVAQILDDPLGDDQTTPGNPVVDIVAVEAGASVSEVTIRLDFGASTIPGCVRGDIELDTDQNPLTGSAPMANDYLGVTQDLGVDYYLNLFDIGSGGDIGLWSTDGNFMGTVPVSITAHSLELTVPLALLGNDDGNMNIGVVVGNEAEPTDAAPATGHGTISVVNPSPTRTATPTSSTSVGSTLRGKVMLQGRPAPPSNALAVPLLVQFFPAPDSTPVRVAFPILDNMGNFTVEGVLPGTYTVRVKHAESLSVEVLALDLSAPLTYDFGLLPMGDGDNNDQVDIIDFSVLRAAFGRTVSCGVGPSATVPCADFDGSGFVDIVDFSLLRANFGRAGPIRVTPAVGAPALTVLPATTQSFTATMTVNTSLTAVNQLSPTPVITPPPTRSATTTPSATPSRGLPALTPSPSRI